LQRNGGQAATTRAKFVNGTIGYTKIGKINIDQEFAAIHQIFYTVISYFSTGRNVNPA